MLFRLWGSLMRSEEGAIDVDDGFDTDGIVFGLFQVWRFSDI